VPFFLLNFKTINSKPSKLSKNKKRLIDSTTNEPNKNIFIDYNHCKK
jgi:hypothetical protein